MQIELRRLAERLLRDGTVTAPDLSGVDLNSLIHELHVYHAELVIQKTELEMAQAESEQSRNEYAQLFQYAPVGIVFVDYRGVIQEANQTAARLLGSTHQLIRGKPFSVFLKSNTHMEFFSKLKAALGQEDRFELEVECIRLNGSTFPALCTLTWWPMSPAGRPTAAIAIHDRTESIRAQKALRKSEEAEQKASALTTAIVNALPAHIALLDPKGNIISINEAWKRFAQANVFEGTSYGLGTNYIDVCMDSHGDCSTEAQEVARGIQDVLSGKLPEFSLEYPCHAPHKLRWFRVMVTPLSPKGNEGAVVMHLDITDRCLAVEILRESEERFKSVVNTALDCVIISDSDGRILEFNPAAEQTFGYRRQEALGRLISELIIPPEHRAAHEAGMQQFLESDQFGPRGRRMEMPALRSNGERITVEFSISKNPGIPVTFTGFLRDITDRKLAEQQLAESHRRFEETLNAVSDLFTAFDRDWNYTYLNRKAASFTGNVPGDLVGKNIWKTFPVAVGSPFYNELQEAVATGKTRLFEAFYPHMDRWFEHRAYPQRQGLSLLSTDITERKKAEERLRASEEQFRLIFEANPHPMWVYDLKTLEFLSVNETASERYGYTREEFLSMTIEDIRPEEDVPTLHRYVERATSGIPHDRLWRHRLKDGRIIRVEIHSKAIQFNGRNARLVLAVDVTLRLQAEEALRASETRLRTILDTEPECVKIVSLDGRLVDMNSAGLRMLEAGHGIDVIGKPVIQIIHPEDRQAFRELHRRVGRGETGQLQFRIIGLKGTMRWMETSSTPLREPNGTIASVLSVTRDVTDRIKAERALAVTERRFRLLLNSVGEGVHGIDRDGRIVFENPAALEMFGYEENELIGKLAHLAVHHHHLDGRLFPVEECPLTQTLLDGQLRRVTDQVFFRKDGSSFPVEFVCAAVRDEQGAIVGAVVTFRDITERKRAEETLRASEERLRMALTAGRMGTFDWDITNNQIVWSQTHYEIFGYTPCDSTQVEYRHFTDRVHPEDFPTVEQEIQRAMSERTDYSCEYRVRLPDGSIRWVLGNGAFFFDEWGKPVRMLGTVMETTQRRLMEEALRASEEQFRAVFQGAATGIAVTNPSCQFIQCNSAFCTMIGYTLDELRQTDFLTLTHADDQDFNKKLVIDLLENKIASFVIEKRFIHRDGHCIWCRSGVSLVRDQLQRPLNIIGVVQDITPLKLAEVELQRSQALLRVAMAVSRLGGWQVRVPDFAITWTDETRAIFEVDADDLPTLEQGIAFYLPEYQQTIRDCVNQCIEIGKPFDVEAELQTARGRSFWGRVIGEAVRNESGRIEAIQGAIQDITEQKLAQTRMLDLASRLTDTLESITDAFFTLDREWRFTFMNPQVEKILKKARNELLGQVIWDVFPQAVGSAFDREYRRAIETQATVEFEEIYPPLGIWIGVRAYPTPEGIAVYFRDVTEQKKAAETVRESAERFRLLARATNDAIWDWNLVNDELWWNEGYETLFGYTKSERDPSIGSWKQHIHPDDYETIITSVHAAIEGAADQWSGEYRYRRKNGQFAYVLDRGYIIRDNKGKGIRMIGGMTDLTRNKQIQEELARSNEDLQQFAYIASHDLQEPLRAVSGCVQVLKRRYSGKLDDRAEELINHSVDGVHRMQTLIHDLLEYSRVNTRGKSPQKTDVGQVLSTVLANLEVAMKEAQASVYHQPMPIIQADSMQLTLLFQNLIGNAIKFRGSEPPQIAISARRSNGVWQFSVKDNGIGMASEYLDRVFMIFQRLHTRTEYPGTGIGLAVCKKIVERHGGRIWVESTPGKGSTFHFTIPDYLEVDK